MLHQFKKKYWVLTLATYLEKLFKYVEFLKSKVSIPILVKKLIRHDSSEKTVFSTTLTHLGCVVECLI